MKLSKSNQRLLDKLRKIPADQLTAEEKEDLEELEQLEKEPEKKDQGNDLSGIKNTMEEILKCVKPTETTNQQQKVEVPTPTPVITNQQVQNQNQQVKQESSLKKLLKAIW